MSPGGNRGLEDCLYLLLSSTLNHKSRRGHHLWVSGECGFDLTEFDPVAPDLYLRITSAEEFDVPVGQVAPHVSC